MTDWRALCAELLDEVAARPLLLDRELVDRARAALAAEPQGEGPPTVMQIIELADEIEAAELGQVDLVRAALARWGRPALAPADGEVGELVEWLRGANWDRGRRTLATRAADLLTRLALQPVPVSERLPGPTDCDNHGRCWWWYPPVPEQTYGYWVHEDDAVPERAECEQPSHWLPAHALPLPCGCG